uniref:L-asparagine oxygenase n=1 Tax=Thermosporothrix sp. COM3 TaxID=2490863 RepID=A0A455SSF1_9CHLR|nr:L-asparagine oxygenase [Thermosporothrix sp. COM3]
MEKNQFMLTLTDEERTQVEKAIEPFAALSTFPVKDSDFLLEIEIAKRDIPVRIAKALVDFRKNSNDYGTLLLRNLPVDASLPPTPKDGKICPKSTHVSECCLLFLMSFLGQFIAYADEKDGEIIHNICPVPGQEQKQENTGSVLLEFHTENAFHPYKPDYVGLYCLRPDHDLQAKTGTASVRRAINRISSRVLELLRQPLYRNRLAPSFMHNGSAPLYSAPLPILTGDYFEPDLCIDFFSTEALTPVADAALQIFKEALKQVLIQHALEPGDLIIVDNRTAAHTRSAFTPRYDGHDRWLQRLFVVEDFRRSRKSRLDGGHICTPVSIEFSLEGLLPLPVRELEHMS